MRYALTAAQQAILRTHPQTTQYHLAVHSPTIISRGILGAVPTVYPGSSVEVTGLLAGFGYNLTNVKAGMTMYVGSEGTKSDYGTIRIRKAPTGSTIHLAEFGSGLINWQSGASLTIVEDYRVWPIHPSYDTATSRWKVDLDSYTSQNTNYGPQVIMGPVMVGFLDNGKMLASYVGNLSYSHTTGVSITSQTWTFPDGQTVTSALGSSFNPIVITYTNASTLGAYHTLKVTDSNGASHIGQRLTFCFGTSGRWQPGDCRFEQITGGLKSGGYRTKIYIDEGATSATFIDGANVVIFEQSSYGTIASSVGGNYFARDNIVLAGRVVADSQRIEPFTNGMSFDLESPDGELRRAQGYDVFLESGSAASDWDMASGLTIDRAALTLAKYRSTVANVMDFNIAGGLAATNEIPYRDLPAGFLWEELNYNYGALFGSVAVDMQGSLWAMFDTQVTGLSANIANVMAITKADRRDTVTIGHPHRDINAATRLYAVQGGGTNPPIAAESPGDRIGYFGSRQEISQNLTAPSQDTLITWAGNVRARDNNPYNNIVIPLSGNIRIDPVPQSYVTMSLSATQSPRGVNWNNQKIIPNEITLNYSGDMRYATSEITAETVVNGIGGSAFTFPVITTSPPPPPPTHEPCPPGYHWDATLLSCVADTPPAGDGNTVYVAYNNGIARSRDFLAASPTWTTVHGSLTSIRDFILEPYDPANEAWCMTSAGLYNTTNLNAAVPIWTLKISRAQIVALNVGWTDVSSSGPWSVRRSIASSTYVVINADVTVPALGPGQTVSAVAHSHDHGVTWHGGVRIGNGDQGPITNGDSLLRVSDYNIDDPAKAQRVYSKYYQSGSTHTLSKSEDHGHTWTDPRDMFKGMGTLETPYDGTSATDQLIYLGGQTSDAGTQPAVEKSSDAGASWTNINATYLGAVYGPGRHHAGIGAAAGVSMKMVAFDGFHITSAASNHRFFTSSNGGVTWTYVADMPVLAAGDYSALGQWPYNENWIYILFTGSGGDNIYFSQDGGATWASKLGNWASTVDADPNFLSAGGGLGAGLGWHMIVPVWVA